MSKLCSVNTCLKTPNKIISFFQQSFNNLPATCQQHKLPHNHPPSTTCQHCQRLIIIIISILKIENRYNIYKTYRYQSVKIEVPDVCFLNNELYELNEFFWDALAASNGTNVFKTFVLLVAVEAFSFSFVKFVKFVVLKNHRCFKQNHRCLKEHPKTSISLILFLVLTVLNHRSLELYVLHSSLEACRRLEEDSASLDEVRGEVILVLYALATDGKLQCTEFTQLNGVSVQHHLFYFLYQSFKNSFYHSSADASVVAGHRNQVVSLNSVVAHGTSDVSHSLVKTNFLLLCS